MKPPASSIANVSSDSNDPPANSPPATTSQNGARSSATGRRPGATPGLPAVIIPPGSRLTDHQATYSDLPTGDYSVERQPELVRVPDGQDVRVVRRFVKFMDDPDSLSVIVAVPSRHPAVLVPVLGISHRKLRRLFTIAISWALARDRVRFQDGAANVYTSTSRLNVLDETPASLLQELTVVDVRSDGLNFDPPTIRFVEPQTITRRVIAGVLALLSAAFFVKLTMLSVDAVLQATNTEAYGHFVYVSARELNYAFTTFRLILRITALAVTKQVARQVVGIVDFLREINVDGDL